MVNGHNPAVQASRQGFWFQARLPLSALQDHPWEFLEWFFMVVMIGSIGVWLVPLVALDQASPWYQSLAAGNGASFCIVLLAEMIPWGLPYSIRLSGRRVEPPRGTAAGIALLLVVVQAACLVGLAHVSKDKQLGLVILQLVLSVPSIATACYLVCFRLREAEIGVATVEAREAEEVRQLETKADSITSTREGDKL